MYLSSRWEVSRLSGWQKCLFFRISRLIFAAELSSMRLGIDSVVRSQVFNPLDAFKHLRRSRITSPLSPPLKRSTHPWPPLILSMDKIPLKKNQQKIKNPMGLSRIWADQKSSSAISNYRETDKIIEASIILAF